jgi:uncharacterized membrane protein YGL010W
MELYSDWFQERSSKLILKPSVLIAFFAVVAIVWSMSIYIFLVVAIALIVFYFTLSPKTALSGSLLIGICLAIQLIVGFLPILLILMLGIAIACQFYGQRIEGENLSFVENFIFQLVGPLWAIGPRNLRKFDLY